MNRHNVCHDGGRRSKRLQKGAATLLVTIMLLIGITFILIYATKVGVLDQKISGNEYRHKEAFANAEAGLEQAAAFLDYNPNLHDDVTAPGGGWVACGASTVACTSVTNSAYYYDVNEIAALTESSAFLVKTTTGTVAVGIGTTADATGQAIVQTAYAKSSLLSSGEIPPIMMPTGSLSGNFNIVPNPNGGGPGVPVSIWAKDTTDTTGANWKTCDMGEFKDGTNICMDTKSAGTTTDWLACSCDTERSNSTDVNEDVVLAPASEFPVSPFAYLFGAGKSDDGIALRAEIKAKAESGDGLLLQNCDTLASDFAALSGSALVWVEGDCDIPAGSLVGNREKPILLVVEGELRVNANSEMWGILMGLDEVVLNGGPVIHGSAVAEIQGDLTNGTYSQVYDENVFASLRDDSVNTDISKVKYSWKDF
jgi:Tfp pilus assembly protein PilX